jgi:hypothetical protein
MTIGLQTPHGILATRQKPTYHVYWQTYAYNREGGTLGLESVVSAAYGVDIELFESPNDTDYKHEIDGKKELDEWDRGRIEQMVKHKGIEAWCLQVVLQDLVNKDVLPAGSYIVTYSY